MILSRPHRQQDSEEGALAGDDLQHQSPLPAAIQGGHLIRRQVAFFEGKVHVRHLALSPARRLPRLLVYKRQQSGPLLGTVLQTLTKPSLRLKHYRAKSREQYSSDAQPACAPPRALPPPASRSSSARPAHIAARSAAGCRSAWLQFRRNSPCAAALPWPA